MIDIKKVYPTNNYGSLRVVGYLDSNNVEVEFITTGYRSIAKASHITRGQVKDLFYPSVYGVGFIAGEVSGGSKTRSYTVWTSMLERCYSPRRHKECPSYSGCTVADEWHNYQNFAKWFDKNYIQGFHLDKDIKIKGNKVYSAEACTFVSHRENNVEAHAKSYVFTNPSGEVVRICNLSKFCRDNKLNSTRMYSVHLGKNKTHRGWSAIE